MVQKTFAQMGKIPVRISRGCDALIDLDYMDSPPRHVGGCQIAQHDPWSAATTHCNNKSSARVYRQPRFFGDDRRRFWATDSAVSNTSTSICVSGFIMSFRRAHARSG
jgi:hypothetical protein